MIVKSVYGHGKETIWAEVYDDVTGRFITKECWGKPIFCRDELKWREKAYKEAHAYADKHMKLAEKYECSGA